MSSQGYLYCLSNPDFAQFVKIGYTKGTVEDRMRQLHTTGVPNSFILVYKVAVENPVERESGS